MRRIVATALFVALRLCVLLACTAALAIGAVLVGEAVLPNPAPSANWDVLGRAGYELVGGGVAGMLLGLFLAIRLGRRRLDASARALQTLAALAVPALLMLGRCMEG